MTFSFCLQLNVLYEVVWVGWCDDVVCVFCFYDDAVVVVCYCHEGASEAWEVVVSAVEAGSEQPEAEWNQRALQGLDGFEWDFFGAADQP